MELKLKTRQIGGSIGIIIPKDMALREGIVSEDIVKIRIEKTADLSFMWGRGKGIKKSTAGIMREIDEGEMDGL